MVLYGGGLVAGALLLVIYYALFVLKRRHSERGSEWWTVGLLTSGLGFLELAGGVLEGSFPDVYMRGVSALIQAPFLILGFLVHIHISRRRHTVQRLALRSTHPCQERYSSRCWGVWRAPSSIRVVIVIDVGANSR